jgi:adenosylcobinamide-phosphate synthase
VINFILPFSLESVSLDTSLLVLPFAAVLDYRIGDPWGWPHPVRVMGWCINFYLQPFLKLSSDEQKIGRWLRFGWLQLPFFHRLAGVGLGMGLIAGSAIISWALVISVSQWHWIAGIILESVMLASCFAGRSLADAAADVLQPLRKGNHQIARQRLSYYVGRDTQQLSEPEILRAVLETVSENAVDGVMGPLFYALIGAVIFNIHPVVLAMGYKAASTLDSMVGYKEKPYTNLGWFSAKLEDFLTLVPCRLTVITLGLLSKKLPMVWQQCRQDATKDPSPNSGWSECTYAVILGVQLGGVNYYRGVPKEKPLLGKPAREITPEVVEQALQLTRWCFLTWLGVGMMIEFVQFLMLN